MLEIEMEPRIDTGAHGLSLSDKSETFHSLGECKESFARLLPSVLICVYPWFYFPFQANRS